MGSNQKEERIRKLALSVLDSKAHKKETDYILSKTMLTKEEIVQAYLDYDLDIYAYENEIYESLAMRVVLHLHNLLKGSWHAEKQKTVLKILKEIKNINSIVDVGFGTPQRYVKDFVLKNKKIKLTLIDLYDSASQFGKVLLNYWNPSWKKQISFKKLDMNTHKFVGKFDVYIFQDSIEHVNGATNYLKKAVKLSPKNSIFIFSIPIAELTPVHTITWHNINEVKKWLEKCGLEIKKIKEIKMNQKVDLFAESVKGGWRAAIVKCEKKK